MAGGMNGLPSINGSMVITDKNNIFFVIFSTVFRNIVS